MRNRREECDRRQDRVELQMRYIVHRMNWELAAFENMDQRVAHTSVGKLIPVERANDAAIGQERDFHELLKTARHSFAARAIRQAAEKRAGAAAGMRTIRPTQVIAVWVAGREIQPFVRTEGEAMETSVVAVAETGENDGAFVRAAIAIGVFKRHEVRRVGRVGLSSPPGESHRRREIFRKDVRDFETTIAVAILEKADPAGANLFLQLRIEITSRRFRDIETPLIVQCGEHREVDLRRTGDSFDVKPGRNSK